MAAGAKPTVGHGEVEDQAPAARPILEEAADLHVAAPLACACRYAVLRPNDVSGRRMVPLLKEIREFASKFVLNFKTAQDNGPKARTIQSCAKRDVIVYS